ncbi:MAG: iron-containing alcohol dehydrogenase, partial [Planctomycetaceae bacterium]|nr:iron-containing alcohol dehydrogenase [Planctomycetaceae bacterium]
FPQYGFPEAGVRYARLARYIGLGGMEDSDQVMVARLIEAIRALAKDLDIPASIQEAGVSEEAFLAQLDQLAEDAFDDQCTGANPRYPLIPEIKQMYLNAFYGDQKNV